MRHRVTFMTAMGMLILGSAEAPGQEAGASVGKRIVNWLGTPKSARAHNHQGVVWDKKGEFDKAIAEFTEAIRLDLKDAWPYGDWACVLRAYTGRPWVWREKHEHDKAIADLDQAIQLDPKNAKAYKERGFTWDEMGKYDRAVADYTEAIRLDPRDPLAYNHHAWLWATCPDPRHRDGPAAVTSATRACELSGWKRAAGLDTLAAAYAEAGDFDAAVKWQQKALEFEMAGQDREESCARLALYQAKKPYRQQRDAK